MRRTIKYKVGVTDYETKIRLSYYNMVAQSAGKNLRSIKGQVESMVNEYIQRYMADDRTEEQAWDYCLEIECRSESMQLEFIAKLNHTL